MFYYDDLFTVGIVGFIGFIFFAIIFSFFRSISLKKDVDTLKKEIKQLKSKLDQEVTNRTSEQPLSVAAATTKTKENLSTIEINKEQTTEIKEEKSKEFSRPLTLPKEEKEQVQTFERKTQNRNINRVTKAKEPSFVEEIVKNALSWFIGGNVVAKVAILILFFGLSFLLKYSIDRGLLSPEVRVFGSAILGFILIGLGFKLKNTKDIFALILQGGGIGVLYITTFAAAKIFDMMPVALAFLLLIALCVVSVIFALSQNALSLAIVAFLGAYLAPILLSDGGGNHIVLFSFYTLVSLGIVVVGKWRSWRVLNLLGFAFTFIVLFYWMMKKYQDAFYFETQAFVVANLIIYGILSVVFFIRSEKRRDYTVFIDVLMLFGTPLLSFLLQYNITKHWEFGPAFSSFAFGLAYLVTTFIVLKYYQDKRLQILYYGLGIALSFATIMIPLAFGVNLTSLVWIAEGSAIIYVALKNSNTKLSYAGIAIFIIGILYVYKNETIYYLSNYEIMIQIGFMSIASLFNACLFYHYKSLNDTLKKISYVFVGFAGFCWVMWVFVTIDRYLSNEIISFLTLFVAVVWIWYFIGKKQDFLALKYSVIALWPTLILGVLIEYINYTDISIWQLGWIFALTSAYFYLYTEKDSSELFNNLKLALHITLLWIVFGFIYNKCLYLLDTNLPWGYFIVKHSVLIAIFSLLIGLVYILRKKTIFPVDNFKDRYWLFGLAPIVLYIVVRLLVSVTYSGDVFGLKFISILNPLEESTLFAFMMINFYFIITYSIVQSNSMKNKENVKLFIHIVLSVLLFTIANGMLVRFLSHLLDIPWDTYHIWGSSIIQASFSVFWTLIALALIVFANKKAIRTVWFVGAVLLGIVVIKLGLMDSVRLEGLIRAFAFIGVALLMLLIGYLAPIPPKLEDKKEKIMKDNV